MGLKPLPIFVYGTLMRGQKRDRCWPHPPLSVQPATVRGKLYDLGPYPALIEGSDLVRGEIWTIAEEHFDSTLRTLDKIEGFNQGVPDLYIRHTILCHIQSGEECIAYVYLYANHDKLCDSQRITPIEDGYSRWSTAM